jgi:hypothetical protein
VSYDFAPKTKRLAWDRCNGRCEYVRDGIRCGAALAPGNRIYDHRIPKEISHDARLSNCQVICAACNREKTAADAGTIAKTRGQRDFHLGIKGPGLGRRPMRGGRRSRERKTFRHGVQPRVTYSQQHLALMQKRYGRG